MVEQGLCGVGYFIFGLACSHSQSYDSQDGFNREGHFRRIRSSIPLIPMLIAQNQPYNRAVQYRSLTHCQSRPHPGCLESTTLVRVIGAE